MNIGQWLIDLLAGNPAPQLIPIRVTNPLSEVQARQALDRQLRDAAGSQTMTDVMRRMRG
nr:hypothetical protein [uncultured Dongia sp.]